MTSNSFEFKIGDIVELIGSNWAPEYLGQVCIVTSTKASVSFYSIEAIPFMVSGPVFFTKGFKVIRQSTLLERIIFNIKIEQK